MSTKKNGFDVFFSAEKMNDFFKNFQSPVVDFDGLLDVHRKNFEAMSQINQKAFDGFQQVMKQQNEAFIRLLNVQSKAARDTMAAGTPEQGLQKQAELAKTSYETTMKNAQEMGELLSKVNDEVSEIVSKRVSATMNEIKDVVATVSKETKKAAA